MTITSSETKLVVPSLGGIYAGLDPLAYPMLRIMMGLFFVPHGAQKLFQVFGGRSIAQYAEGFGRMGDFWGQAHWVYYIGFLEFFGGLMMAAGFLTRVWAAQFVGFMAMAAFVANWPRGWFWTSGGTEAPLSWCIVCLYILIRGAGAFSVDARIGRQV
jgi:putative oxidoreductase